MLEAHEALIKTGPAKSSRKRLSRLDGEIGLPPKKVRSGSERPLPEPLLPGFQGLIAGRKLFRGFECCNTIKIDLHEGHENNKMLSYETHWHLALFALGSERKRFGLCGLA
jgi:hypothetical protein